jgi:DNA-binding Xre family transcriptional regulator
MPIYTGALGESVELAIFQTRMAIALRRMRGERLFKANDLSKRVGISQTHMTEIMRGRANISLSLLHAFCRELNVEVTDLIGSTADTSVEMPAPSSASSQTSRNRRSDNRRVQAKPPTKPLSSSRRTIDKRTAP